MSDANLDLVRRAFAEFRADGVEALFKFISPDFEGEAPPDLSTEPDTYVGHEGVRRWFAAFEGYMEDVHFEADELTPAGDRVIVEARLVGRGTSTGLEASQRLWQVWTIKDGLAVRLENYATVEAARRAAGLAD